LFSAFSFPIIFSLGMGNPIGFVVLSCYALFIFRSFFWRSLVFVLGGILKVFPFLETAPFIFKKEKRLLKTIVLVFIFFLIVSWLIFPKTVWFLYLSFLKQKFFLGKKLVDVSSYNQSFASTMARFGVKQDFFSWLFLIWILILVGLLVWYFKNLTLKNIFDKIEAGVLMLSFSLLIHPFPWQYYYAVFLPYLMIKIKKEKSLVWWLIFLLVSVDGKRFFGWPSFIYSFLSSSQFFACLLLFLVLVGTKINHNANQKSSGENDFESKNINCIY
jgi:hypothetical protein